MKQRSGIVLFPPSLVVSVIKYLKSTALIPVSLIVLSFANQKHPTLGLQYRLNSVFSTSSTVVPILTLRILKFLTWTYFASDQRPILLGVEYLEDHPTRLVQIVEKWIFDWMHTKFKSKASRSMMLQCTSFV